MYSTLTSPNLKYMKRENPPSEPKPIATSDGVYEKTGRHFEFGGHQASEGYTAINALMKRIGDGDDAAVHSFLHTIETWIKRISERQAQKTSRDPHTVQKMANDIVTLAISNHAKLRTQNWTRFSQYVQSKLASDLEALERGKANDAEALNELMKRIGDGDDAAVHSFLHTTATWIKRISERQAQKTLSDPHTAQEMANDIVTLAISDRNKLRTQDWATFSAAVQSKLAYDLEALERGKANEATMLAALTPIHSAEELDTTLRAVEHRELARAVDRTLEKLSPKDAQLIQERFFDGLTNEEIANLKRATPETVKREVYRTLQKLKEPKHAHILLPFAEEYPLSSSFAPPTMEHYVFNQRTIIRNLIKDVNPEQFKLNKEDMHALLEADLATDANARNLLSKNGKEIYSMLANALASKGNDTAPHAKQQYSQQLKLAVRRIADAVRTLDASRG